MRHRPISEVGVADVLRLSSFAQAVHQTVTWEKMHAAYRKQSAINALVVLAQFLIPFPIFRPPFRPSYKLHTTKI